MRRSRWEKGGGYISILNFIKLQDDHKEIHAVQSFVKEGIQLMYVTDVEHIGLLCTKSIFGAWYFVTLLSAHYGMHQNL